MWARIISVILGIWLMAAPTVLDYTGPARDNDHIVGPLVVSFAIIAHWEVTRPLRWIQLVLGFWLLVTPWVLGYELVATLNSSVVGLLLMALSTVSGKTQQRVGGWSSLWK
jgi:hypothetical protein